MVWSCTWSWLQPSPEPVDLPARGHSRPGRANRIASTLPADVPSVSPLVAAHHEGATVSDPAELIHQPGVLPDLRSGRDHRIYGTDFGLAIRLVAAACRTSRPGGGRLIAAAWRSPDSQGLADFGILNATGHDWCLSWYGCAGGLALRPPMDGPSTPAPLVRGPPPSGQGGQVLGGRRTHRSRGAGLGWIGGAHVVSTRTDEEVARVPISWTAARAREAGGRGPGWGRSGRQAPAAPVDGAVPSPLERCRRGRRWPPSRSGLGGSGPDAPTGAEHRRPHAAHCCGPISLRPRQEVAPSGTEYARTRPAHMPSGRLSWAAGTWPLKAVRGTCGRPEEVRPSTAERQG